MGRKIPSYITKEDILRVQNLYFRGHNKQSISKITNFNNKAIESIIENTIDKRFLHRSNYIPTFTIHCVLKAGMMGISNNNMEKYFHLKPGTIKYILSKYGNMEERHKKFLERKHKNTLIRQQVKKENKRKEILTTRELKKDERLKNIFLEDEKNKKAIIPIYEKKTLNIDFFKTINSEEKAYWLGFISADGYTTSRNMTINLSFIDVDHLQKLKLVLNCNTNFKYLISNKTTIFPEGRYYNLQINNKQFVSYINQYKTQKVIQRIPNIDSKYLKDFIRGILDADGCIFVKNKKILLNFAGYKPLLEDIQKIIKNQLGIYTNIYPRDSIFQLQYRINDSLKILPWLYENATVYLTRKYKKYLEAINCRK